MSNMIEPSPVLIALSDSHLSLTPPISRSVETSWLEAQDRSWRQVRKLQRDLSQSGAEPLPVVIAGDFL